MKKSDLTTLVTAATLFLSFGVLNATAGERNRDAAKDNLSPERRAEMMKKADLNGDGKLDDSEKAALKKQRRDKMAQNPRFLKLADTDRDGEISDAEFVVAQKKVKKMRDRRKGGKGDRGDDKAKVRRAYMLGKFDANGDKKLDETERAAMRADIESKMRAKAEEHLQRLNAVDVNKDGKFSDEEWEAAKKEMMKDGPRPGGPRKGGPRGPGMHRGN